MDLQAAERIAGVSDPNAIMALQKQSGDPAVGKAVAEQFGTLLMERALQNADGSALAMASGVGSNVVNSMFAGTIAQTAMSGDRLGLADLLFRSMTAKQSAAGGHAAAAAPAAAPHAMPATGTAAGPGLPLSPYWQDHGLRPLGDRSLQRPASAPAPMPAAPSRGGATPVAPSTAAPASASPTHTAPTAAAATPIAVTALPPIAPASASTKDPAAGGPPAGGASAAQMAAFAGRLGPLLDGAARQIGVSARVLLAQAALETGWGRSVVGNNVFGVKAGSTWSGSQVEAATHEVEGGRSVSQTASFRSYGSLEDAVRDFVSLVGGSSRYRAALGAGDNARNYAEGLIKGGYATDGDYPAKLAAVAASPAIEAAVTGPIPLLPPNFAGNESRAS